MSEEITDDIVLEDEQEINEVSDIDIPEKLIKIRFLHFNETE